jgi:hypothetical protein
VPRSIVALHPPSFPVLNCPFWIFSASSIPENRYRRMVESLESQHRPDSLLHSPMVLLHPIVQVRAGSNLDATRKLAVFLHLTHRPVRGRIGVQRDRHGHASVLHGAAQKAIYAWFRDLNPSLRREIANDRASPKLRYCKVDTNVGALVAHFSERPRRLPFCVVASRCALEARTRLLPRRLRSLGGRSFFRHTLR